MKKSKLISAIFIGVSFIFSSLSYAQIKSPSPSSIKGLPNGTIVGNYSVAVYDIEREENFAHIKLVSRKMRSSLNLYPFKYVVAIDDHDNKYVPDFFLPIFSDEFENLLISAPVGLTWSFSVTVQIPEAAPIVKVELYNYPPYPTQVSKAIGSIQTNLFGFDIEKEIRKIEMKGANLISIGSSINQGKYLQWSIGKIRAINTWIRYENFSIDKEWLIPITVDNLDYNPTQFNLRFFFQLNDGAILPYKAWIAHSMEDYNGGYYCEGCDGTLNNARFLDWQTSLSEIHAKSTKYLNYYHFPVSINRQIQEPIRVFVLNGNGRARGKEKLYILRVTPEIFEY